VSLFVETFCTSKVPPDRIVARVREKVDLRPRPIIERLGLLDPSRVSYLQTAKNGHFGNPAFPWESTDLAAELA